MQNKKQISLLFSTYDDIKNSHYGGGGAIAVHEVAKRLSHKYDVCVLSWNYSGKTTEVIDDVRYERFGLPLLSPKIAMFVFQISLPFLAMVKNYDVWMESFCPPFTTAFLPLFTNKPVIGIVHMLAAQDMERKYKLPFHLIQNLGLKLYQHIIVTSTLLKEKIHKLNPMASIDLVSNGITKVYDTKNKSQKYILFLGRIEVDQKGMDLLISAFKQFNAEKKNTFQLIIAGDGDHKEVAQLKQIINDAGIEKSVILKGRVSGTAKETLLRNAACLAITSRFETYSLVALEALAHATPIVSFAIEGLSWIPQKTVKRVRPFAVNDFAKAMVQIVSHPEIAASQKKEGVAYAKQFTWDTIAALYTKYIDQI